MGSQQYLISGVICILMLQMHPAPVQTAELITQDDNQVKAIINEDDKPLTPQEETKKKEDLHISRTGSYAFLKLKDESVYNRGTIPKSLFESDPLADWLGADWMPTHSMEVSSEELGAVDSAESKELVENETINPTTGVETTSVASNPEAPTKKAKTVSSFSYSFGGRHFTYFNDPASKTKYVHQYHDTVPFV